MVLEFIINNFSCIFKIISRNTFPKPDSASYEKNKKEKNNYKWLESVSIEMHNIQSKRSQKATPNLSGCCQINLHKQEETPISMMRRLLYL